MTKYHVSLQASFKKIGYTEQFATVNVNDGELTIIDVMLHKV